MLRRAVVVARDRAGADVDLLADRGVAEIGEVVRLRAAAERRLLQLDEVADVRVLADVGVRPEVRERPTCAPLETCESMITQKLLMTTPSSTDRVHDRGRPSGSRSRAPMRCRPFEVHARDG